MLRMYMGLIIINAFLMHSSAYSECEMRLRIINAFLMHSQHAQNVYGANNKKCISNAPNPFTTVYVCG